MWTEGGVRGLERVYGLGPREAYRHSSHVGQWVKVVGEAEALEGYVSHHVHEHGAPTVAGERIVLVYAAAPLQPPGPPRITPVVPPPPFNLLS